MLFSIQNSIFEFSDKEISVSMRLYKHNLKPCSLLVTQSFCLYLVSWVVNKIIILPKSTVFNLILVIFTVSILVSYVYKS